ncbi:hypothetical protein QYP02_33710 [Pseudomonas aeruginosa]|nr:hypothetical protein [Pseudomonas aeruginosa]
MSKVAHQSDPVMLNEQSFEQFGSDQVAYKIWCSIDTAFELLGQFDPPVVAEVALNIADIQFEIIKARFALMVLVKRLCGWRPEDIDEVLAERLMEKLLQVRIPRHSDTQPTLIRTPVPRSFGQAVGAQRRRGGIVSLRCPASSISASVCALIHPSD